MITKSKGTRSNIKQNLCKWKKEKGMQCSLIELAVEDWISESPVMGYCLVFIFSNSSRSWSLPNFVCVVSGSSCMDISWLEHYSNTSLENDNDIYFYLLFGCPTSNFETYRC